MRYALVALFVAAIVALVAALIGAFPERLADSDDQANLAYSVTLAVVIAASLLLRRQARLGEMARAALGWVVIGLAVAVLYTLRDSAIAERLMAELQPSRPTVVADAVVVRKSADGSFLLEVEVNGTPVRFLVDTGASSVALTPADARRLGFDPERLTYSLPVQTAGGPSSAAPVRLERLRVGPIAMTDVRAHVSRELTGNSLLGMTFLSRLSRYEVAGDKLTLSP
jgi:aspartyl protease family protein